MPVTTRSQTSAARGINKGVKVSPKKQQNKKPVFDIEKFIISLPENIETIDVSFKSLTYLPFLKRFHKLKKLDCSFNNLTSLPELNDTLEVL